MTTGERIVRMALGVCVCGSFLGSAVGAGAGLAYGVYHNDLSAGLDGALLGNIVFAITGLAVGAFWGATDPSVQKKHAPEVGPDPVDLNGSLSLQPSRGDFSPRSNEPSPQAGHRANPPAQPA